MSAPDNLHPRPWDTNNPMLVQIFCAAISGLAANKYFLEGGYQGSPNVAVAFADSVVLAALTGAKP